MKKEFRALQPDEVISVQATNQEFFKGLKTFTLQESTIALQLSLGSHKHIWLKDGVTCKVLTPGGEWQIGKVKLSLVFCPDQVESDESLPESESSEPETSSEPEVIEEAIVYPLDEIRRSLNNSNETS